jgi:hypothetical protein
MKTAIATTGLVALLSLINLPAIADGIDTGDPDVSSQIDDDMEDQDERMMQDDDSV